MSKPTKPFIFELKVSRRKRTGAVARSKSLWDKFAPDFQQSFPAKAEESPVPTIRQPRAVPPDLKPTAVTDSGDAAALPPKSEFMKKWAARKADKPTAGSTDVVANFLARIERQKALLAEFQSDPAGFTKWRSAWFRQVAGGFGVSVTHDSVDAGGLRYVVVDTADDVVEFLDDLAHHAQRDVNFQAVLRENRQRHAARRFGGEAL
jgi:hypothetical protein